MEKNKKSMILAIVAVISFIIITVGATLAFFNYAKTGSTENTIETGSISFIYEEVNRIGNGISIEDALPTSDSEGKAQTNYFDFKVTSSSASTIAIPYEITTRVVDGSDDLTDYVKLYLTKVNGNSEEEKVLSIYSDLDDSTNTLAQPYGDKTLYEDEIPADSTNFVENYRLRMWIDDSVDFSDESFNNKTFSIKVNVYANGEQANQQRLITANTTGIDEILADNQTFTLNTDPSNNYDYYLEVSGDMTQLDLDINTANPNATVNIESITPQQATTLKQLSTTKRVNLSTGANYFKVTVTSANRKNSDIYVLKISRVNLSPVEDLLPYMTDYTSIDEANIYRYTGTDPDNYVTFAGDTAGWRIVGYFDGYLKLVKINSLGAMKWNDVANGLADWDAPATLRTELNDSKYAFATDPLVSPYNWCLGKAHWNYDITYAEECSVVSTSQSKVGLVSQHDVMNAQWIKSLTPGNYFWTITKDNQGDRYSDVCAVIHAPLENSRDIVYSKQHQVLPAVYLKKSVEFTGEGTIQNPYVFSKSKNIITFDVNGGTVLNANQIMRILGIGNAVGTLPTTTRSNYAFMGWYTEKDGGTLVDVNYIPADSLTLYAHWAWIDDCSNTNTSIVFDYTGSEKIIRLNCSGTYKLETWGAQGGDATCGSLSGGLGGYSTGTKVLSSGTDLYINVGGQGNMANSQSTKAYGGYNGGAMSSLADGQGRYGECFGSGGGATHIALESGLLSTFETKQNNLLLVAGGGGGAGYYKYDNNYNCYGSGGAGGGLTAGDAYNSVKNRCNTQNTMGGYGASQTVDTRDSSVLAKGTFGNGGIYQSSSINGITGGGGGYYGGDSSAILGAGGGSGYIGGVTNGQTITGNLQMPTPNGGTEIGHPGNGYVKITYLGQ